MKNQIPFKLFPSTQALIDAISIFEDAQIIDALKAIDKGALGLAFIVDPVNHAFLGLVTDGDIRRALIAGVDLNTKVKNINRPNPSVGRTSDSPEFIASLLNDKVKILPILDENQKVVDIAVFDQRVHLPVSAPIIGDKELLYVSDCLLTGWVSSAGKYIPQFEKEFSQFCNCDYGVATSSGTTALHLALEVLGIGPGDEVIVPTLTFIATANAVKYAGATPVFVDSEIDTWNINPDLIKEKITKRTKAVMPVHLFGHPCKMDSIIDICKENELYIIEDAAEAHGALYKGQKAGSMGEIVVFSFYGNKLITTGEGGMIVTNSADIASKAKILRDHGMSPDTKYIHPYLGYNYRMTNMQAALGVAQLERIDELINAKRKMASIYIENLKEVPGLRMPPNEPWAVNSYWLFSVIIDEKEFGVSRDRLISMLKDKGIDSRPVFYPVHKQPIYNTNDECPVAEYLSANGISLPSSANLQSSEIDRVCEAIKQIHSASSN